MPDRRGVLLLMYDLPNATPKQRQVYYRFRKALAATGFISVQKSVYIRLLRNVSSAASETAKIRAIAPSEGTVNVLQLSLNSFKAMATVSGDPFPMDLFSDDIVWN